MSEPDLQERPRTRPASSAHPRSEYLWLAAILALGLVLRLIGLGSAPYWHDEVHMLISAEHLADVLWRGEFVSNNPPLFSILLAGWRAAGLGANEWTTRLLTVVLGLGGMAAVYAAGKRLFSGSVGLVAAFLLAISPFHILHSQDLKAYILLPFTGTLMVLALHAATERNTARSWALYALSVVVACYSDVFAAFLLVGTGLWFVVQLAVPGETRGNSADPFVHVHDRERHNPMTARRLFPGRLNRLPGYILANIAGIGLFLPYAPVLLHRTDVMLLQSQSWWVPKPNAWSLVFYLKTVAFGYSDFEPWFKVALAAFLTFALVGLGVAWASNRRAALLLLLWFAAPVALVFVASCLIESIFLFRALLPFAVPYYVLIAVAVAKIPKAPGRIACCALFALLAAPSLWQHYHGEQSPLEFPHRPGIHPARDYDKAARHIVDNWRDGDVAVHASASTWLPFYWYGLRDYPQRFGTVGAAFAHHINAGNPPTTTREAFAGYFPRNVEEIAEGRERIWFVFSEWERVYLPGNASDLWRWLDAHFTEIEHDTFQGIELFLYDARAGKGRVNVVQRDEDDGVSARLLHRNGGENAYLQWKPDAGVAPSSLEARKGSLTLRFDEAPRPASGAQSHDERSVAFSLENTSAHEAPCTVMCVPSSALFRAASAYRSQPEEDVWWVRPHYNPAPPPQDYETSVATARFDEAALRAGSTSGTLRGSIALPPGTYATSVFVLGTPGDAARGRAGLTVSVNGAGLLPPFERMHEGAFAWSRLSGNPVTILPGDGPAEILLTANHTGGGQSFADAAWIAFAHAGTAPNDAPGSVQQPWPGALTLSPGETASWTAQLEPSDHRIDVWAYEHTPTGCVYWIYRQSHRPAPP